MRQSLARSLHSSNLKQKEQHCDLDSVHALGLAAQHNPIGVAALHVIDALQPQGYQDLIYALARQAGKRIKCDKRILVNVCKQVIFEAAFNFCQTCSGRKHAVIDNKVHLCAGCNGTGLKRHTDRERSKTLNISEEEYIKYWANRFTTVQSIFSLEYRNALHTARLKIIE